MRSEVQWHAVCEHERVPYRDSTEAIRECIAELEGERSAIDRELAALREQLAALAPAPYADGRDPGCLAFVRVMAFVGSVAFALLVVPVTWGLLAFFRDANLARATGDVDVIRSGALEYGAGESDCPTVARLIGKQLVDEFVRELDPWDTPYAIECVGSLRIARSMGPDGLEGGGDDITSAGRVERTAASRIDADYIGGGSTRMFGCSCTGSFSSKHEMRRNTVGSFTERPPSLFTDWNSWSAGSIVPEK